MLLSVPSQKPGLALVDLGPAPIHHGDVLHLALIRGFPDCVVVHVVLDDLVALVKGLVQVLPCIVMCCHV